jgi:serine phosphatase RsbU (regulator of sigma subunit)
MLIGALDLATGEARLINAGHENPFVLRGDARLEDVAMEGGPPFCITDYPWPVESLSLAPGDTLVLLTDGVTEAQDEAERIYGRERLAETLRGGGTAKELIARVLGSVREFEGGTEASDDLTLMAIRYVGS